MASTPIYEYTNSSLESSLSTRTRLWAERPGILGSIRGRFRHNFLLNRVYRGSGAYADDLAKLITNKKQFLQQLKKYLIDKPFYTMEEFFEY